MNYLFLFICQSKGQKLVRLQTLQLIWKGLKAEKKVVLWVIPQTKSTTCVRCFIQPSGYRQVQIFHTRTCREILKTVIWTLKKFFWDWNLFPELIKNDFWNIHFSIWNLFVSVIQKKTTSFLPVVFWKRPYSWALVFNTNGFEIRILPQ